MEYLEGTAMARVWFEVLEGYYRGVRRRSCVIDLGYLGLIKRSFPPSLEFC
jgi:hypothetical protein